jgi:hypothetical protein
MSVSAATLHAQHAQRDRSEKAALADIAARLAGQFPELSAAEIANAIQGRYDAFDGSRIRDFVPILVERSVRTELITAGHEARRASSS